MKKKFIKILKLIRPKQWIKNFAVFPALVFTGQLFNLPLLIKVLLAFVVFCGLSSAVYVINDIFDIQKDRMHPFKKFRPLANRDLSIPYALVVFVILSVGSLLVTIFINPGFFFLVIIYLIL